MTQIAYGQGKEFCADSVLENMAIKSAANSSSADENSSNSDTPSDGSNAIARYGSRLKKSFSFLLAGPKQETKITYHGVDMTKQEIKEQWAWSRRESANRGTYMHAVIEQIFCDPRTASFHTELRHMLQFYEKYIF